MDIRTIYDNHRGYQIIRKEVGDIKYLSIRYWEDRTFKQKRFDYMKYHGKDFFTAYTNIIDFIDNRLNLTKTAPAGQQETK